MSRIVHYERRLSRCVGVRCWSERCRRAEWLDRLQPACASALRQAFGRSVVDFTYANHCASHIEQTARIPFAERAA